MATSSEEQISDGNVLMCDGFCIAMWQDGNVVNYGEHYWKIHFESNGRLTSLQLTNKEKFWNETNYGELPYPFQKHIKSGDTIGILASSTNGKLKCYIKYNNQSLELAYELHESVPPSFYPAIEFVGDGPIRITKETEIPSTSEAICRNPKNIVGLEGRWTIYAENIVFSGVPLRSNFLGNFLANYFGIEFRICVGTLFINPIDRFSIIGQYTVNLKVVNYIWAKIKECDGSWKGSSTAMSTMMSGTEFSMELEHQLSELVLSPDTVKIEQGKLHLQKGKMMVTFVRQLNTQLIM